MKDAQRTRNPLINSAAGGRLLSALQLPIFLLRPPAGYGVLTTVGRKTGKRRRRCIRAVERGGIAYVVAIKGSRTGWLRNVQANPKVRLRIRSGTFDAVVREVETSEREGAVATYCEMKSRFEYLEYAMWLGAARRRQRSASCTADGSRRERLSSLSCPTADSARRAGVRQSS